VGIYLVHLAAVMLLERTSFSLDLVSVEEEAPSDMAVRRGLAQKRSLPPHFQSLSQCVSDGL